MIKNTFREQVLFSTILIKSTNDKGDIVGKGTGFLIQAQLSNTPDSSLVLLVSNKHVLETSKSIAINYHRSDAERNPVLGSFITRNIGDISDVYYPHPDPSIDLACVNLSADYDSMYPDIHGKPIKTELLSTFDDNLLNIGQRLYYVGYPEGRFDITNNLPIMRTGSIASHPRVEYNGKPQFLIDSNVFKGSSGSPVFINVRDVALSDGLQVQDVYESLLIGVITETMTYRNKVVSAYSVRDQDEQFVEEILGIGLVYKSTVLLDLINTTVESFENSAS